MIITYLYKVLKDVAQLKETAATISQNNCYVYANRKGGLYLVNVLLIHGNL